MWALQEISRLPETGMSCGGEATLVLNDQCATVRTNVLYQSAKAELELGSRGQGRLEENTKRVLTAVGIARESCLPETGTSCGGEATLVLNDQCATVRTNVLYQSTKAKLELGSRGQERLEENTIRVLTAVGVAKDNSLTRNKNKPGRRSNSCPQQPMCNSKN